MGILQLAGTAAGHLLAPVIAEGTRLRRGRLFHAYGSTWGATVLPRMGDRRVARLADRLSGRAIVRLSRAFLPPGVPLDLLGCAIRFRNGRSLEPDAAILDQDLLFATVSRPWLFGPALLLTAPDDPLANTFHGTSPFLLPSLGRIRLRLVPLGRSPSRGTAEERLEAAVREGLARFVLELTTSAGPWSRWSPVVEVRLETRLAIDDARLAFSPFRTGAGLEPIGFVHGLRKATYRAAQRTRRVARPDDLPTPIVGADESTLVPLRPYLVRNREPLHH